MDNTTDPRLTTPPGDGVAHRVCAGVANIRTRPDPDAMLTTQALHGETCRVFEKHGAHALVQLDRDRYVGWADLSALSPNTPAPTNRVCALRTYMFSEPDLKSQPLFQLSLNARVSGETHEGDYVKCADAGWIHQTHLGPVDAFENDPAGVAIRFVGAPYLWGGRDSLGLDCSGLTVAAYSACGVELLRDSDMQFNFEGEPIKGWDQPGALKRGDLVFWDGHVGIMLDAEYFVHANAFHMATATETLAEAIERIAPKYGRPIGAKRINLEKARRGAAHGPAG